MREVETPLNPVEKVLAHLMSFSGAVTRPVNYRGYYILTRWLGRLIDSNRKVQLRLAPDSLFEITLRDPYWNRLLNQHYCYEAELYYFLELLKGQNFSFVDGGANWGYWSVLASSSVYGAAETIAYEPMPAAFSMLSRNAEINQHRFSVVNQAIAGRDMSNVSMGMVPDAELSAVGASLNTDGPATDNEILVDAMGIDRVLSGLKVDAPAVIKLDLEGVEHEVITASEWIHDHDCVLIFEDHAMDTSNEVTAAVLSRNWPVFFFQDDGRLEKIESLDHVTSLKKVSHKGYNFFGAHPGGHFDHLLSTHLSQKN